MPKLPSYRRINTNDYSEEYKQLIETLASTLNPGIEVLFEAFNGKVSFRDNISSIIKEIEVEVDASGKPKNKASFKVDNAQGSRLEGIMVIKAENLTNSTIYPNSGVLLSYTETVNEVIINNIAGLPANNIFRLKLVAIK